MVEPATLPAGPVHMDTLYVICIQTDRSLSYSQVWFSLCNWTY